MDISIWSPCARAMVVIDKSDVEMVVHIYQSGCKLWFPESLTVLSLLLAGF